MVFKLFKLRYLCICADFFRSGELLNAVFGGCLFDIPTPGTYGPNVPPKCKSTGARGAAYELLVEMATDCAENLKALVAKMVPQHAHGTRACGMDLESVFFET